MLIVQNYQPVLMFLMFLRGMTPEKVPVWTEPPPDEAIWMNASALHQFARLGQVNQIIHHSSATHNLTCVQPDAHLVDRDGQQHPVHSMLLRLKYPVFQNLQEFTTVTLDDVSSSVVRLIIDIAYGTDRFQQILICNTLRLCIHLLSQAV